MNHAEIPSWILELGSDDSPDLNVNVILHRRSMLGGDVLSPSDKPTGGDLISNPEPLIRPDVEELELDALAVNDEPSESTVGPIGSGGPDEATTEGSEDGISRLGDEVEPLVSPGAASSSEATGSGRVFPELDSLQDPAPSGRAHFSIR